MLFDTLGYWVFFAAALLLTALRDRPARLALVALSYVFYASWDWRFCAPLAGSAATRISPRLAICFPSRTRPAKVFRVPHPSRATAPELRLPVALSGPQPL